MKIFLEYAGLRKEIYVLFFSKIITCMGSMVWTMMTIILSTKIGLKASEITLWMLIFSLCNMPIQLIGGKIADHFNKKKIIIYADSLEALVYMLCFFLPLNKTTMIICLIATLLENLTIASYDVLVADLSGSNEREKANSLLYLGTNMGMLFTPIIGGFLVNKNTSLIFLINGLSTILALIIEALYLKNLSINQDKLSQYEKPQENSKISTIIKNNLPVLFFILIDATLNQIYNEYSFLVPLDLTNYYGDNGSIYYGYVSSINCLVVVTCTTLITKIFVKISELNKLIIALILYILGYIIFKIYLDRLALVLFAFVIFTFGEIFATLATNVFITKRIPASHRGRILSCSSFINNLVYMLIQRPISKIYDDYGSNYSWNMVFILSLLIIISLLILKILDQKRYPLLYKKAQDA